MQPDPHECAERAAPFRKAIGEEAYFAALNAVLATAELPDGRVAASDLPIVYIVGVPRSGTTLLSQLASRFLPLGYIDNVVARFWLRPSVGIRLSRAILGPDARAGIRLDSTHGTTEGPAGPHEFGYFWRHWLRLDRAITHKLAPNELAAVDVPGLQRVLEHEILAAFAGPVVFKNVICGLQARLLTRCHPRSLFVAIERDPLAAAASILAARQRRYGNPAVWWSLKPSSYPEIAALPDPVDQVARQVLDIRRELRAELSGPGVQALHLDYAKLCADPAAALRRIGATLDVLGWGRIDPVDAQIPSLTPSRQAQADGATLERLRSALAIHDH